jgi:cytoskeletal protein CcmA (bactofilin family)
MRRRTLPHLLVLGLLALVTIGVLAPPAGAQDLDDLRDRDRRIAVGDAVLREGEQIDGPVVAIDGDATVNGRTDSGVIAVSGDARVGESGVVDGDVFVIDGAARIAGRVTGDVIVINGRAIILDGATVRGDVRSTKSPRVERGASVRGDVETVDVTGWFTAFGVRILGLFWLAVTISTAVLGLLLLLLFPRPAQTTSRVARGSVGKSIGIGVLVAIGLPVLAVLAIASLVGLPFGLGLAGALGLLHAIGYVVGAYAFGRILVKEPKSPIGAFFAGWAILRVLALIPGIGALVWIAASVWGIGALTVALWRGSRGPLAPPPEPKTPAVPPASDAPSDAPGPSGDTPTEPADDADTPPDEPTTTGATKATATKATATKATKANKTTKKS